MLPPTPSGLRYTLGPYLMKINRSKTSELCAEHFLDATLFVISGTSKGPKRSKIARQIAPGDSSVGSAPNSGFEPRSIRPWVIDLWKQLPLVAWRFAYDELAERDAEGLEIVVRGGKHQPL